MSRLNPKLSLARMLPWLLIVAGIIGLIASFTLTYDKIHVIQDASYKPYCNLNPILSCGSVMKTEQASLLGVPNTIFGVMAFTALSVFGFLLATGAKFSKGVWLLAQLGATAGVVFMHYLFFQGVFRINAICPWCFVVWMITIPTFFYITLYNLKQGNLTLPKKLSGFIQRLSTDIIVLWYLAIFGILIQHFWYYWSTLL